MQSQYFLGGNDEKHEHFPSGRDLKPGPPDYEAEVLATSAATFSGLTNILYNF
jgi:hypothetical protein